MGKIALCGENGDPLGTPQDSGVWKIREIRTLERSEELGRRRRIGRIETREILEKITIYGEN